MSETSSRREANEEAFDGFVTAVFEGHDLDTLEEYLTEDCVMYDDGQRFEGADGIREHIGGLLGLFPDFGIEIYERVDDDERTMMRFECSGTHRGDLQVGPKEIHPATGIHATWEGFGSFRYVDGAIAEQHIVTDTLGLFRQLGVFDDENAAV